MTERYEMKTFKSDNTASVHPKIMAEIVKVNTEHASPYGDDPITHSAEKMIRHLFGGDCHVSFVLNGTGANVIGLSTLIKAFHGVLCADTAHINVDECGAFERYTGSKLITVPHVDGKIRPDQLERHLEALGNEHHNQPKVISISQLTEWGSVYTIDEIKALAEYAHDHDMYLHVDGARIANAAVALDCTLKEMITDTGVDVLSFGGAKNGMMYGEAIVSFQRKSAGELKYSRKQGMQLMSKMRYISAQYIALLEDDLWKANAKQANACMARLYDSIKDLKKVEVMTPPDGNMLFAKLPQLWIDDLLERHYFYQMTEEGNRGTIRLVTSFDTTFDEIDQLIKDILQLAQA